MNYLNLLSLSLVILLISRLTDGKGEQTTVEPPTPPANESHCAASTGNHFVVVGPPGRDGRDGPPGPPGVDIQELRDLIHILTKEEMRSQSNTTLLSSSSNGYLSAKMIQEIRGIMKTVAREEIRNSFSNRQMIAEIRELVKEVTSGNETQNLIKVQLEYDKLCPSRVISVTQQPTLATVQPTTAATTSEVPIVENPSNDPTTKPPLVSPPSPRRPRRCKIGLTPSNPASSCKAIRHCDYPGVSGYYWIRIRHPNDLSSNTSILLYCHMEPDICGVGGMTRVAFLNMNDNNTKCPSELVEIAVSGKRMCALERSFTVINQPVTFPTHGIPYNRVCGKAIGYGYYWGGPAFNFADTHGFDGSYTSGLSISYGPQCNRRHIWTYAIGYSETLSDGWNCPCAYSPGRKQPDFIGHNDFYCESPTHGSSSAQWYMDNPLWDGEGCYSGSSCCTSLRMPWFWKTLNREVTEPIEVRWSIADPSNHKFGVTELELYIY